MRNTKYAIQILALIAFSIITALATLSLADDTLIRATTLQIRSLDAGLKPENLEVSYSSMCRYQSGIFFPEAKICGSSSQIIPVQADGTIHLPALQKASGRHGDKTNNYEVSLTLQPKGRTPRDQTFYFIISARGEEKIQKLQDFREAVYVGRLNGTTVNLTAEGRPVLAGDLAKAPNANLFVSVEILTPTSRDFTAPSVISATSKTISLENREGKNGFASKTALRDATKVELQSGAFAFTGNPADAKVVLRAWYSVQVNNGAKILYKKDIETKIDTDALKDNKNIDLEKVR